MDVVKEMDSLLDKLCNAEMKEDELPKLWGIIRIAKNIEELLMETEWKYTKPK